jgi:CubicO group peptidase (beta-lactamase class C family)
MRILLIILFSFLISPTSFAKHQYEKYSFSAFWNYIVTGSDNYYQFQSDLIQDKDVIKELKNKKKTRLVSYLLFEDDKIKIDEQDLPRIVQIHNGLLPSHSMGKSLVSYVTGYAICEGYIDNLDVKLDDWSTVKGTLYEGQKLIDLLNMRAGDQKIIGEKKFNTDNWIKDNRDLNVNVYPIKEIMKLDILQTTKKSKPVYNYNALATNIIMNYTIFKVGDDYQKLLNKVFKEDAKIKNSVFFHKTIRSRFKNQVKGEYGRYSFYADRYDYLRIAKSMMDHWNNDTCVGKYLKTIYEQRINKNKKSYDGDRSGQFDAAVYTKKYGGQFHFDIIGLSKRKILGMSGFGGQNIIIDFEKERIIVVNSRDRHYNWKKIVLKKLKQK